MSIAEIFGWTRSFLDSFGLTNFLIAFGILGLATAAYRRFFDR